MPEPKQIKHGKWTPEQIRKEQSKIKQQDLNNINKIKQKWNDQFNQKEEKLTQNETPNDWYKWQNKPDEIESKEIYMNSNDNSRFSSFPMIDFTTTFTIQRFSTYVFRDTRIAPFKMEISPIVFECHWKT